MVMVMVMVVVMVMAVMVTSLTGDKDSYRGQGRASPPLPAFCRSLM